MLPTSKTVGVYSDSSSVDVGGACEGAQVVVQQDNAGPHIEVDYRLWMQHIFDELGWMYEHEPQAPQGMRNTYPVN
jgi:hypothetical protein